jgi:hypothetical protein
MIRRENPSAWSRHPLAEFTARLNLCPSEILFSKSRARPNLVFFRTESPYGYARRSLFGGIGIFQQNRAHLTNLGAGKEGAGACVRVGG